MRAESLEEETARARFLLPGLGCAPPGGTTGAALPPAGAVEEAEAPAEGAWWDLGAGTLLGGGGLRASSVAAVPAPIVLVGRRSLGIHLIQLGLKVIPFLLLAVHLLLQLAEPLLSCFDFTVGLVTEAPGTGDLAIDLLDLPRDDAPANPKGLLVFLDPPEIEELPFLIRQILDGLEEEGVVGPFMPFHEPQEAFKPPDLRDTCFDASLDWIDPVVLLPSRVSFPVFLIPAGGDAEVLRAGKLGLVLGCRGWPALAWLAGGAPRRAFFWAQRLCFGCWKGRV